MKRFLVYRSGPPGDQLLEVTLKDKILTFRGHANLVSSLKRRGVDDLVTRTHFSLNPVDPASAEQAYSALKARFKRASSYRVEEK